MLIEHCAIACVDDAGTEHRSGHVLVEDGRIAAIGEGGAPDDVAARASARIDAGGCIATPGLVNCHHHLYQWLTRGRAQECTLFEWLVELYPTWARIDDDMQLAAAYAGLAALATSGCTTSTDHHYLHPRAAGDMLALEVDAARRIGMRFHPCRGSMDLGTSKGGLPPDEVVEDRDTILQATAEAVDRFHDPSPGSMLRIAVAPCSPFSVTRELMVEAAQIARDRGVRMHTHLAETVEEERYCIERFGVRPVDYLDELGWLGPDVWLAHCIHLNSDEVHRFAQTGTGVAHCPSSNARLGAGIAPVADLVAAGAAVGLGVDGAASNEAGEMQIELHEALLVARLRGGPAALSARTALRLGTIHGARCLGRDAEIGSLEVGKLADIALWRLDSIAHAGVEDPVAALVMGPPRRVDRLLVCGREVVVDGRLVTDDEERIATELARQAQRLRAADRVEAVRG